ncbi:MAG: hypothetical protein KatS3mg115_0352 [Candidatus Poribacteria bacterium]|nr:MAG: hypothetical protein KatS3mg115_0352 [Candidatus Poribacteria bacterium]
MASKTPLLTREEEVELAKQIEKGSQEARDRMIRANLRLVISVASQYVGYNVPLADLIQEGNIGLMRAVEKFDYRKGYKFSTYAIWWIRQSILRALDNHARVIRLPTYIVSKLSKMDRTILLLRQKLQREPTSEEIAEEMGVSVQEIEELMAVPSELLSLEVPVDDSPNSPLLRDFIGEPPDGDPLDELIQEEIIRQVLDKLPDKERRIILLRYGLEGCREHTLREIGDQFHVTRERVRQIERAVIRRLRQLLETEEEITAEKLRRDPPPLTSQ